MRKLIWKEWHEQSWKLGFGCVVLGAMALIGLRSRIFPDETTVLWICLFGFTLLPVLTCTGLIPAERSDGTMESLLALPVTPREILMVKSGIGLLLCAGPMIVAAVISLAMAGNREITTSSMIMLYVRSTLTGLSLFIWMQTLTIRLPSEARAAMLAVGLLIFWFIASEGLIQPQVPLTLAAISPLCFVHGAASSDVSAPPLAVALLVQGLLAIGLWFWASRSLENGRD